MKPSRANSARMRRSAPGAGHSQVQLHCTPKSRGAADTLVGQEARRGLRPGEALRAYDLSAPVTIERGETVDLIYQVGTLTLTARARAMESAAEGEMARFVNLQSNRTVEARAHGPGLARVGGYGAAS